MPTKLQLHLSERDLEKVREMSRELPPSKAEMLRRQLAVWRYMEMARHEKLPIHASFEGIHILNDAAIKEISASATLSALSRTAREKELLEQRQERLSGARQKMRELYEALELKPNVFGFGVDLKLVFKMFWKDSDD